MKQTLSTQLEELETLSEQLAIKIIYEKIRSIHPRRGGLCQIKGEYRLYIEKKTSLSERVAILLETISLFNIDDIYVSPKLRELLDAKQTENRERGRILPIAPPAPQSEKTP